jgi:hypothetical protein
MFIKSCALSAIVLLSLPAHAVLINFDDLTYVPGDEEFPHFADTPVSDQYASLGLYIADGYLLPYGDSDDPDFISGPNFLLGGNSMTLFFSGELPTHVGMYVMSPQEDAIFLEAYGTSGLIAIVQTAGYAGPFVDSPYVPKQYVTFNSNEGIDRIDVRNFYGSRVSAMIDDLTFTHASVPEPSLFALMGIGLATLFYRRRKKIGCGICINVLNKAF